MSKFDGQFAVTHAVHYAAFPGAAFTRRRSASVQDQSWAVVDGCIPRGIGITKLMDLPDDWSEQKTALGLPARF